MIANTEDAVEVTGEVTAALGDAQIAWLGKVAAQQTPPLTVETMLSLLVDQAIDESQAAARRRAEQLEIYRGSGYEEHHPDYPDFPNGLSDV